jgi:hypothetical protein
MKDIYKISTVVLFILWLLVMWKLPTVLSPKGVVLPTEEETPAPQNDQNDRGMEGPSYSDIIERLRSPFPASRYNGLVARNIFLKPEKPQAVFSPDSLTLVSVQPVRLPFMYNGFIQTPDGSIIGQITWSGKTYFAKKSGKFKDYKVIEIDKKKMTVEDKDGERLILNYKKPVAGTELIAKLYNSMDNNTYEIRKEEEINGYKVLDIKIDSVILYGQNKEWVINKER